LGGGRIIKKAVEVEEEPSVGAVHGLAVVLVHDAVRLEVLEVAEEFLAVEVRESPALLGVQHSSGGLVSYEFHDSPAVTPMSTAARRSSPSPPECPARS